MHLSFDLQTSLINTVVIKKIRISSTICLHDAFMHYRLCYCQSEQSTACVINHNRLKIVDSQFRVLENIRDAINDCEHMNVLKSFRLKLFCSQTLQSDLDLDLGFTIQTQIQSRKSKSGSVQTQIQTRFPISGSYTRAELQMLNLKN